MSRRIRGDHPNYELRNARVRVARRDYPCDLHGCLLEGAMSQVGLTATLAGTLYAHVSTGLRFCSAHFTPEDIVEVPNG